MRAREASAAISVQVRDPSPFDELRAQDDTGSAVIGIQSPSAGSGHAQLSVVTGCVGPFGSLRARIPLPPVWARRPRPYTGYGESGDTETAIVIQGDPEPLARVFHLPRGVARGGNFPIFYGVGKRGREFRVLKVQWLVPLHFLDFTVPLLLVAYLGPHPPRNRFGSCVNGGAQVVDHSRHLLSI